MKRTGLTPYVLLMQYITCHLAEWPVPETVFSLIFILLWQGIFISVFSRIEKKQSRDKRYIGGGITWILLLPCISLISPLMTIVTLICLTIYELRKISGSTGVKEWLKSQIVSQSTESDNKFRPDFEPVEFGRTNPATGLPMSGIGVDIAGNPYGSNNHNRN